MAAPHIAGVAVLAQQLAELQLGRRLTPGEFLGLLKTTGDTIFDGDDEDDNVLNTNAYYKRVNVEALAEAIYDLASDYPLGQKVQLGTDQDVTNRNLGARQRNLMPSTPDLIDTSDSGRSVYDNITRLNGQTGQVVFRVFGTVAGATLKIYANGSPVYSMIAKANVTLVTLPPGQQFNDGTVAFKASQTVAGIPESALSAALNVTFDTAAPVAPAAPDLAPANDSGIRNDDNLTNAEALIFNFSQSGQYNLYRNGELANWSYVPVSKLDDISPLSDGTYTYTIREIDLAGNVSADSAATVVSIDKTVWPVTSASAPMVTASCRRRAMLSAARSDVAPTASSSSADLPARRFDSPASTPTARSMPRSARTALCH